MNVVEKINELYDLASVPKVDRKYFINWIGLFGFTFFGNSDAFLIGGKPINEYIETVGKDKMQTFFANELAENALFSEYFDKVLTHDETDIVVFITDGASDAQIYNFLKVGYENNKEYVEDIFDNCSTTNNTGVCKVLNELQAMGVDLNITYVGETTPPIKNV